MPATPLDLLGQARTVLLTTFRKDGTPVPTPVWVVRSGNELRVWTSPRTGKFKRVKRNPAVTLAPSTFRGTPLGVAVNGSARILTRSELDETVAAIKEKYGWFGRWSLWQSAQATKLRHWPDWSGFSITLD